jgi:hypothetical protein
MILALTLSAVLPPPGARLNSCLPSLAVHQDLYQQKEAIAPDGSERYGLQTELLCQ